ncbi:hypothetical protein [Paenibacillus sp. KR2-11]|uniref:hypothetical protein n=1 Tax=Paenibacillus sp. KR2-11 TaxID=3385500 RepID=UPI0038FBEF4B
MLRNEDFAKITEATPEQLSLVINYVDYLFSDEHFKEFWDSISSIDKAIIHGRWEATKSHGEEIIKPDLVRQIRDRIRTNMHKYKESPGFSQSARYTHDGLVYMYVFEDVKVPIHFIAETPGNVYVIKLALETTWKDDQYIAEWKVRIFDENYRLII